MKIPDAKDAVDEDWDKMNLAALQETKVGKKAGKTFGSSLRSWTCVMFNNSEVEQKFQKYKDLPRRT